MTRNEVNQVYYLNREIEMWQRVLGEMRESGPQSPKLDGMPRGRIITDPTGDAASVRADIERVIENLLYSIQIQRKRIYEYIGEIDDSLMRQIIMYRCMSLCSWEETATYVGGGNTADSVRMKFNRHFEKNETCSQCSLDV